MNYRYGKNVFLTGGSSGIGLATAELFAENGYTVFAASRNPNMKVRSFPGGGEIRPIKLDVCDPRSVKKAAESVLSQADIGIVIHSAGLGIACPAEEFPEDAIERLMETNFTSILRINSHFLPHLRNRKSGLCIMISSVASIFPIPFQSHYCSSKAAIDSYAAALRMELYKYKVKVSLLLPGDTHTGFTSARSYDILDSSPYYGTCINAVRKMEKDELGGRLPISAARKVYKLSMKRNPPLRTIVGFEYKLLAFVRRFLPDKLTEKILKSMYIGRE